jgi:hypothetical protein
MKRTRADVAQGFRWQATWCGKLGSPLYCDLLTHAAGDIERGGPVWDVLDDPRSEAPGRDGALPGAQALRLMGAAHRLVLAGRAPELARFYPSVGGVAGDGVREAFGAVLEHRRADVIELIGHPVQTNEPGRSAALLGGFLEIARRTGLPLRTLEVGASAGLNLRWDRYFYSAGPYSTWGDPDSAVRFPDAFADKPPPLHVSAEVVERRGCDTDPLDPASPDDRLTLLSYVWPDQEHRFGSLRAALELAPATPAPIDRAPAVQWLEEVLAEPRPGVATVVFHSVVLPYLGEEGVADLKRGIEEAGARATDSAPLAWLSMEAGEEQADVRLTTWPGADSRVLARTSFHGPPVKWLG